MVMVIDGVADVHDNVAGPAMLVVENDKNHMVLKLVLSTDDGQARHTFQIMQDMADTSWH